MQLQRSQVCGLRGRSPRLSVRASAASMPASAGVAANAPARKSLAKQVTAGSVSEPLAEPPGPAFLLPLLGETSDLLKQGQLRFGLERLLKYGPVFKTSWFGIDHVSVCDPELYKALLVEDNKLANFEMTKGTFAKLQSDFNLKILSNHEGSRMPFRRTMLPSVSQEALASYVPKMLAISQNLVNSWAQQPDIDLPQESRKAAMQFANSLLAGIQIESEEDEQMLRDQLGLFFDGMTTFDIDLPGTPLNKALKAKELLTARVKKSVAAQIDAILAEPVAAQPGGKARKNMLGYVIDSRRAEGMDLDVGLIADLAVSVLQAGTDTSSAGLATLMAVLTQRPDLWAQLREEQAAVIAKHGADINKASLDSCKLLDACVRESLRFQPPAATQMRRAMVDFQLGGYFIKKGTLLMPNLSVCQALEADPFWFVRAKMAQGEGQPLPLPKGSDLNSVSTSFDPARWMGSDPSQRPNLFTFGHGPHTCIGMSIYIQEAKVLLACLLRKGDLVQTSEHLNFVEMPLVKPGPGVRLQLRPLPQPMA